MPFWGTFVIECGAFHLVAKLCEARKMFVDQADIEVLAGDGGRDCVSMRKEKYIPHGGPDGGGGGDGGSVYLEATQGVDTLLDMVGRRHWYGETGEMGKGKKQAGKDGKAPVIRI